MWCAAFLLNIVRVVICWWKNDYSVRLDTMIVSTVDDAVNNN